MTIAASQVDGIVLALTPNSRKHPAPPAPPPPLPTPTNPTHQTPSTTAPPSCSGTPSP